MPPSTPVAPTPRPLLGAPLSRQPVSWWALGALLPRQGQPLSWWGTLGSYLDLDCVPAWALVAISHCVLAPREGWSPLGAQNEGKS